jgi:hypothetical protein
MPYVPTPKSIIDVGASALLDLHSNWDEGASGELVDARSWPDRHVVAAQVIRALRQVFESTHYRGETVQLIQIPSICCRHCGQILLVPLPQLPTVGEYFEKVVLHENTCQERQIVTELAQHYTLIDDDPEFGLNAGDVLACVPTDYDEEKLIVVLRVGDDFNPRCSVYKSQVQLAEGCTTVKMRSGPPWGFERA